MMISRVAMVVSVVLMALGACTSSAPSPTKCGPGTVLVEAANECQLIPDSSALATDTGGASDGSVKTDAGGGGDASADDLVTVAIKWVFFELSGACSSTNPITCITSETCPPSKCSCPCPSGACQPATVTSRCCAVGGTIAASSLTQLVADYPACTLVQSSPKTYSLTCPMGPKTNTYSGTVKMQAREDIKYTDDKTCTWTPPYAVP